MGGVDAGMTDSNTYNESCLCLRCHWKGDPLGYCNAFEPQVKIPYLPTNTGDCYFISEARWKNRAKEDRDKAVQEKVERSKRYWNREEDHA